ncbi:hypothetical protein ACFWBF_15535 [Streptomyces sp. NPDC060028]|uniref:hypothetical protein n=1 Tax=Streptomyces sp. NPDC060028 TaxID=3347041 RepID=UPI0036A64C5B
MYIAAFVPDQGEQLGALIDKYPGSVIEAASRAVPHDGLYDRARARQVVQARGAHVAMINHPRTTTRLIEQAARATG